MREWEHYFIYNLAVAIINFCEGKDMIEPYFGRKDLTSRCQSKLNGKAS